MTAETKGRQVLGGAAAALAATAAGCAPIDSMLDALTTGSRVVAGAALDSLNGLARAKGLRFGNALGAGPSGAPARPGAPPDTRGNQFKDEKMRALMIAQCGILVPENELKWYALRKTPMGFDFSRADKLIAFAEANGMAVRGHNLLWNRPQYPPRGSRRMILVPVRMRRPSGCFANTLPRFVAATATVFSATT